MRSHITSLKMHCTLAHCTLLPKWVPHTHHNLLSPLCKLQPHITSHALVIVHKLIVHGYWSESGLHSFPSRNSWCPGLVPLSYFEWIYEVIYIGIRKIYIDNYILDFLFIIWYNSFKFSDIRKVLWIVYLLHSIDFYSHGYYRIIIWINKYEHLSIQ